jgi:hypothetical protein
MKKAICFIVVLLMVSVNGFAYNPNSFYDSEEITVIGQRPKVEIEVSELTVNIEADEFVDGIVEKEVTITNSGVVPCRLALTLKKVPVDLNVIATVDSDRIFKGESTTLRIRVELSEQQEVEDFQFNVLVEATLN